MAVKKLEKVKLAKVKLTKAFGHIIFRSLRTMTSGRGQFSTLFTKHLLRGAGFILLVSVF
ncbi:hypothetical protein DS885_09870 [Psychromonas sp. B3M02]|nr:hypothetical protein DS885_09870 [Psychromonas sp. B3M02]